MSAATEHSQDHGHGDHPRFLAHHFDTQQQQFDAGKLGMWLFLVQEILFFSGLFCAYAIYRANHPEIFVYAHHFLDRNLGAINTGVLIFSSFTIAWAVRCVQLNQIKGAVVLLVITFVCAGAFLGIKYVEYEHKWKDGLLWGKNFNPQHEVALPHGDGGAAAPGHGAAAPGADATHDVGGGHGSTAVLQRPNNVHIFFGIYFAMTGLHALHVIIGMGVILWMIVRCLQGHFNSQYFGPVEFTGLYWHLVDLVWIYLFPLLYLIH